MHFCCRFFFPIFGFVCWLLFLYREAFFDDGSHSAAGKGRNSLFNIHQSVDPSVWCIWRVGFVVVVSKTITFSVAQCVCVCFDCRVSTPSRNVGRNWIKQSTNTLFVDLKICFADSYEHTSKLEPHTLTRALDKSLDEGKFIGMKSEIILTWPESQQPHGRTTTWIIFILEYFQFRFIFSTFFCCCCCLFSSVKLLMPDDHINNKNYYIFLIWMT